MPPNPDINDLRPVLTRDIVEALSDRPNEPEARRAARAEAAARGIKSFAPRDGVEVMLAGQAMVFEALVADAVHELGRVGTPELALRLRQQIMAMAKVQMAAVREIRAHRKARAQEEKAVKAEAGPAVVEAAPAAPPDPPPAPIAAKESSTSVAPRPQPSRPPVPAPHSNGATAPAVARAGP